MFLISVTIILVYALKEISGKVDHLILNGLKQEDPKLIEAIKDHILIPPQTKLPYNFSLVRWYTISNLFSYKKKEMKKIPWPFNISFFNS